MTHPRISYRVEDAWVVGVDPARPQRAEPVRYITHREAEDLLRGDPAAAEKRAETVLAHNPQDPLARLLKGAVLLRKGDRSGAKTVLEPLARSQPQMNLVWRELGFARAGLGDRIEAIAAFEKAIDLNYRDRDAWYALGDLLAFPAPGTEAPIVEARALFHRGQIEAAEAMLREKLAAEPDCAPALKLLADIAICTGRWQESGPLLERALAAAPDFIAARFRYATMLFAFGHFADALPQADALLKTEPHSIRYRALRAMILRAGRQNEAALAALEALLPDCADRPGLWYHDALLLRAKGDIAGAHTAFRRAIACLPSFVDACVSLAGVKTIRLDEAFLGQVQAQLARDDLAAEDRAQLHFVAGKALEDLRRYAESFAHYKAGNDILREGREYGAEVSTRFTRQSKRVFTPAFFRARAGCGHSATDPIFIVGMPRSGSTLVEQILASHSAIEGLGELPHLQRITEEMNAGDETYPDALKGFSADRFRALGEKYLALARAQRISGKPFFTDKFPGNFSYTGLIGLILPNAKIIDVRRHPLDCGLSCYKTYFPKPLPITYDLRDIGRAYADYVELMAHVDALMDGRVHRVIYEQLVADPEHEIRRLLAYLGLPFEESCLKFHENRRPVLTLSIDQVRMPLTDSGIGYWRHYAEWLTPLKEELGCVLDLYPEVPRFFPDVHAVRKRPMSLGDTGNPFSAMRGLRQTPFENAPPRGNTRRFP